MMWRWRERGGAEGRRVSEGRDGKRRRGEEGEGEREGG